MREFPFSKVGIWEATFVPTSHIPEHPEYVLAIPCEGTRVLLVDSPGWGWSVPAGKVEEGEGAREAVVRELWEEAGVVPSRLEPLGYYVLRQGDKEVLAGVFLACPAEVSGGELAMRWVLWEDLPKEYYNWNELFEAVFQWAKEACSGCLGESSL
jgi:8-oxo-dGTP pyrophosphatase MutT (NUDIX family)